MIKTIDFNGKEYPRFQAEGNAAQYAIPFAKQVCIGKGYDIGCGKLDWKLEGAIPIDPKIDSKFDANNLPNGEVDYIFSSHCLEHILNWDDTLDYWTTKLKVGGVLFLYLPHYSQEYWRPWNNKKHKHIFTPEIISDYMKGRYKNVFISERDLNNSFMVMGEKK